MRFATYGRKSVFSDHSDSVDNQRRMCRDYIDAKFPGQVSSFEVYQDEGFTGADTDRPALERLLQDVRADQIDALVVYQLDRLSRDVRDFSNIYALLEEKRVMFISIKESIDTSTPIGRAMMYVTMVFAQMERETIATRILDNLEGLARKGFWCIGTVPTGYIRKYIDVGDKKHCTLEPDPVGAAFVRSLYSDFLSRPYSVKSLTTTYRSEGRLSPAGRPIGDSSLHRHLTNPFYCAATPEVYDYWEAKGCAMDPGSPREKWDGTRGVMVYGKHRGGNRKRRLSPPGEWIVSIGLHPPIISADQWLAAQEKFARNTFDKTMKYGVPLLKGVLRCGKCGGAMSVQRKKLKSGGVYSAYGCVKRSKGGGAACDMSNTSCAVIDGRTMDLFRKIEADPAVIASFRARDGPTDASETIRALSSGIAAQEAKLARLAASLASAEGSGAVQYIIAEIERQDLALQAMRRDLNLARQKARMEEDERRSLAAKADRVKDLMAMFESYSDAERNEIVKSVIQEAVWDGESLFIKV